MTNDQLNIAELPELPHTVYNGYADGSEPLYTTEQIQDYAIAAQAPLIERIKELEKDAERYRVLRDDKYQRQEDDPCVTDDCFNAFFGEGLDDAVDQLKARYDAALASSQGEQK